MKKYEVEVEVLYVYAIEAEDERAAIRIAQSMEAGHAPYLERSIASVGVEEVDDHREPGHTIREPPVCAPA
jgi:hypothetical protein